MGGYAGICICRSGRDSPTCRRPRNRLQAIPFESRDEPRRRLTPIRRLSAAPNVEIKTKTPACAGVFLFWRSGRDSNPRPPA